MQTFAPDISFETCAKILDWRRLGKQRVETFQILKTLLAPSEKRGWRNHPACKQWRGYENKLVEYGIAMCNEWIGRGYKDTTKEKIQHFFDSSKPSILPPWWKTSQYHSSHRSVLLVKNPEWYNQFGWVEEPKYEYWWPTENGY